MSDYGYAIEVPEGYEEAILRTRLALRGEGFSIITEMHVGGKLGADGGNERQYLIIGAWAAPASERPVGSELQVAVHLPCNVVVQETSGVAIVAALDPSQDVDPADAVTLDAADSARKALGRALETISQPLDG